MNSLRHGREFWVAALLFIGCTTVQVTHFPTSSLPRGSPRIENDQAVAILTFGLAESSIESSAVDCISRAVHSGLPTLRVLTPDEFRRAVFAYRLPDHEGDRAKYLDRMLNHPALRNRMIELGLRYLIVPHGITEMKPTTGWSSGAPGVGGSPGGYALFVIWDRKTALSASILDVGESRPLGNLQVTATGQPWLFSSQIVFTFGAPAFTESAACTGLGDAIVKFLAGEDIPAVQNDKDVAPTPVEESN